MHKFFLTAAMILSLGFGSLVADELPVIGAVNFATCVTDSKTGKKEQENLEAMRKQIATMMEDTDKELKDMAAKFEDPEYLDSLSPKAEEEMKTKFQTRQEDMARLQNQFYQMMNHAQMQLFQKVNATIAKAAEKVAAERHLDYVLNKELCFYINPKFEVTSEVISEMDKNFDLDEKTGKLTENIEELNAVEETTMERAG